ncbi:hypothetical protein BEWA_049090 [Theileria equi strain WA]|uniref:Uncharacterized protein n=1 Tax=Theileria equi strain WA TaxID=1537102 RepID=L1LAE5_THEEQ|nr:hypothetical protein BEWA_049090 [Theileria equi strain WA]EKX72442.1 hypothetical protein BEWA_049090 [Theileria equi strain WA]|eukprot:XP_004831894.1 hypothetical protein BEWA_049090 [Theileria equi strain WA]
MGTGSMSDRIGGTVTIDMGYYPGGNNIEVDSKGRYYYKSDNKEVILKKEDYPIKYGPYKKLTHTLQGVGIKSIAHNGVPQTVFPDNISGWESVTVYYWSGDTNHNQPLLLELKPTTGSHSYYALNTDRNKWSTWKKDTDAAGTLRERLNKQNCKKNGAHIMDLSRRGSYQCPGCVCEWIAVSSLPVPLYNYKRFKHYISSANTSITRFKDNENDQVGLPSIKHRLYQCLQLSIL